MSRAERLSGALLGWQQSLWLLIAVVTPLFVNLWVEQQFEASKLWLLRPLIAVLFFCWLAGWMSGGRVRPLPDRLRTLLLLLFLLLSLSTLLSGYPTVAFFGSLERAGGLLTQTGYLLLFLCVTTVINPDESRLLLRLVGLTALPIALLALAQAAGWQPLPMLTDARSPLTTTLGRANFTGAYLAMLLPLLVTSALEAEERVARDGYGLLAIVTVVVIALTQARAAWVGVGVGVGLLAWLRLAPGWSRPARWLSALGGGVALAGTLLLLLQRGLAVGDSTAARWTIWEASLRLLWPKLWLGYGADTLELYFPSVFPPQLIYYQGRGIVVDRAHNWLLDWSLSYGVVATGLLVALLAFILHRGWQGLTGSGESRLARSWLAAAMAAVGVQLVGNLLLFEVAATAVLFWLLLAILTAATTRKAAAPVHLTIDPRLRVLLLGGVLVGVAGTIWGGSVRPLLADMQSWQGTRALARGDLPDAIERYAAAVRWQPHRAAYQVALALTAADAGDFARAERAINMAIRLRPTDPAPLIHRATIHARQAVERPEERERAYASFEEAIRRGPTIALSYQQYADAALRLGDLPTARTQAERAVALDATDARSFAIIGWVRLQERNLAAAEAAFDEAVHWQPDDADFHLGLATTYYLSGEIEAARRAVAKSLRLDPTYVPALTLQLQLEQ